LCVEAFDFKNFSKPGNGSLATDFLSNIFIVWRNRAALIFVSESSLVAYWIASSHPSLPLDAGKLFT
jgi:hypothetical protein